MLTVTEPADVAVIGGADVGVVTVVVGAGWVWFVGIITATIT